MLKNNYSGIFALLDVALAFLDESSTIEEAKNKIVNFKREMMVIGDAELHLLEQELLLTYIRIP